MFCIPKPSIPPVCGLSINKNYNEGGGFNPEISIHYNGISYQTNGDNDINNSFRGGFDTTQPQYRVTINPAGDSNDYPPKGYSDIIFNSREINHKDFDTISNCIKSNSDSIQAILNQVKLTDENEGYGTLRELIYTNRDPYVIDYYVCDANRLLTLEKPTYKSAPFQNQVNYYLVGELSDSSDGIFGNILNNKFYPYLAGSDNELILQEAKNAFDSIAKCKNHSGQTIPISNSEEEFIKNLFSN
jgi:hypothetical protein